VGAGIPERQLHVWFTHASITTLYDHAQRHILVLKAREQEAVI
jgi:hypothetical protein